MEADGSSLATGNLTFDDTGAIQSTSGLTALSWNPGGGAANPQLLTFNYNDVTQYGLPTVVRGIDPNGFATGNPTGVDIDKDGIISMLYSNGEISSIGQVSLAKFSNPQGLFSSGSTSWVETNDSGRPQINQTNSVGSIKSGALEDSNVDLTEQLVRLIAAQRFFQANAQSIRAGDTLTQTIINLE